jgi:hypothetical protein
LSAATCFVPSGRGRFVDRLELAMATSDPTWERTTDWRRCERRPRLLSARHDSIRQPRSAGCADADHPASLASARSSGSTVAQLCRPS